LDLRHPSSAGYSAVSAVNGDDGTSQADPEGGDFDGAPRPKLVSPEHLEPECGGAAVPTSSAAPADGGGGGYGSVTTSESAGGADPEV
jgi:hypothetical protein